MKEMIKAFTELDYSTFYIFMLTMQIMFIIMLLRI